MIAGTEHPNLPQRRAHIGISGVFGISLACFIVLALFLMLALPRVHLFGFHTAIIVTGSMEPTLKTGSLLIERQTDPQSLSEGDIISFRYSEGEPRILHRIVGVREEDRRRWFTTKGDANPAPDSQEVSSDGGDVYELVASVPYGGYLLTLGAPPLVALSFLALGITLRLRKRVRRSSPAR